MEKPERIKNIAVIGAGTMGPGMALVFAQHGFEPKLLSRRQETLDKAKSVMQATIGACRIWHRAKRSHRSDFRDGELYEFTDI